MLNLDVLCIGEGRECQHKLISTRMTLTISKVTSLPFF